MNFKDKNPLFSKKSGFSSIEALDKCRKKRKIFIFQVDGSNKIVLYCVYKRHVFHKLACFLLKYSDRCHCLSQNGGNYEKDI